jgi:NTP pyrophosphatase (non-canonical NTP hydrolase)
LIQNKKPKRRLSWRHISVVATSKHIIAGNVAFGTSLVGMETRTMTIREYQKHLDDVLQQYEKPYWEPLSQLARLIEEVGEAARILNHKYGDKPKKATESADDLSDELGDIIYSVAVLANNEGVDLEIAMMKAIEKLQVRDKDRFKKKTDHIA